MYKSISSPIGWVIAWIVITLLLAAPPALVYSGQTRVSAFFQGVTIIGAAMGIFLFVMRCRLVKFHSKQYALKRGAPKRLEVLWTYGFRTAAVRLDGVEIGTSTSATELRRGVSFQMPDGSILQLKVSNHPIPTFDPIPDLLLNGKPVPDSLSDPGFELKIASNAFIGGGCLSMIEGIAALYMNPGLYAIGIVGLTVGFLAIVSGVLIRKRSRIGLWLGVFVAAVGVLSYMFELPSSRLFVDLDTTVGFWEAFLDLIDEVLFFVGLFKGFEAINYLEEEEKTDKEQSRRLSSYIYAKGFKQPKEQRCVECIN